MQLLYEHLTVLINPTCGATASLHSLLIAKSFPLQLVDCRTREPGVLILSPFAGAGGMMHEALLVNPYEVDACVYNIFEAIEVQKEDRIYWLAWRPLKLNFPTRLAQLQKF